MDRATDAGPDAGGHGRIHSGHPFATPVDDRAAVRQARGRLVSPVTLWTAGPVTPGGRPAGLTVSSVLVVEPDALIGVISDENDLADLVAETGRFVVTVLDHSHRALADAFAFVAPAPGGPFAGHEWQPTAWGPVLRSAVTWIACEVRSARDVGYGRLIEAAIAHVELGAADGANGADGPGGADEAGGRDPLAWHHGRYRHLRAERATGGASMGFSRRRRPGSPGRARANGGASRGC
ncbi:MAG: flavin reductase family protein, partial [Frankia sp.]